MIKTRSRFPFARLIYLFAVAQWIGCSPAEEAPPQVETPTAKAVVPAPMPPPEVATSAPQKPAAQVPAPTEIAPKETAAKEAGPALSITPAMPAAPPVATAPAVPSPPPVAPPTVTTSPAAPPPNKLSEDVKNRATLVATPAQEPGENRPHQAVYTVAPATVTEMIKRNGPIFVEWPKPQVALLITGEQWGYFEPCGCAGLDNQKGGMSRRYSMLKQLREQGWNVVPIDVGGMIRRFGRQQEIKFQASVEALRAMKYRAIGWGMHELRLSTGEVAAAISETDGSPSRYVSANVGLFGLESGLTPKYVIVEEGGRKFGITSVLADSLHAQLSNPDVGIAPAEKSLAAIVPELKQKADTLILLSHGTPEESRKLGERFTEFQFVVTASGADEPPYEPRRLGENRWLIDVGHKGMYGVMIGFFDQPAMPLRYQRVPFDARFADSPEMHALMTTYQQQLEQTGWDGLGVKPKPHSRATDANDRAGQFVGSEKCGECHTKAMETWKGTSHAEAFATLEHLKPQRIYDAECVSCHVTGWSPQEYFPYTTGFLSLQKTPHLVGVGCENCHGPGGAHVAAESGMDTLSTNPLRPGSGQRDKQRAAMRVALGTKVDNVCSKCHDIDNSPEFELMKYWEQIAHPGKD